MGKDRGVRNAFRKVKEDIKRIEERLDGIVAWQETIADRISDLNTHAAFSKLESEKHGNPTRARKHVSSEKK